MGDRYIHKGLFQRRKPEGFETVNSPFELSYWYYALSGPAMALRLGLLKAEWEIVLMLSPLAHKDGLYLAAETALIPTLTPVTLPTTWRCWELWGYAQIETGTRRYYDQHVQLDLGQLNWGKTWGWVTL